jgi:hypothetical protein
MIVDRAQVKIVGRDTRLPAKLRGFKAIPATVSYSVAEVELAAGFLFTVAHHRTSESILLTELLLLGRSIRIDGFEVVFAVV